MSRKASDCRELIWRLDESDRGRVELRAVATVTRARIEREGLVFAAVLPLAMALILLPGEFTHYKRWLDLGADETALRFAVLSTILSKTLLVILSGLALLTLCARFVQPRALRWLSLSGSVLVLGYLAIDLELQANTGSGIRHYWAFLSDPDQFRWVGDGFETGPSLWRVGRKLAIALSAAGAFAWLVERWVAGSPARRGTAVFWAVVTFEGLGLIVTPALRQNGGAPGHLYHLSERMPWGWRAPLTGDTIELRDGQRAAQRLYARALPKLAVPQRLTGLFAAPVPAITPDILVVIVESLRHDALSPETMPQLWAHSKNGIRLDAHYATSNASHYGLFSLLYGRSPMRYFETLDTGERPTLTAELGTWGYSRHHLTCSDIRWREMDRFMGSTDFEVERFRGASLDACDRRVVDRARSLLEPGQRPPRFVLAVLMSTHFGYHYPPEEEVFRPSADPPNALARQSEMNIPELENRYRNSAHYVDSLIGRLLDRVDLRRTLIVVTGDHGESLFDDGTITHSSLLSEIQTRVPFAMMGPGIRSDMVRPGPTSHIDLLPTVLARLGIDGAGRSVYPGKDLLADDETPFVPLVHAKARRNSEDRVALVSATQRFSIRVDPELGELRLLGHLEPDGRPSRKALSAVDADRAVDWIEIYLDSLMQP